MKLANFRLTCGIDDRIEKLVLDDVHRLLERVGLELRHRELLKELGDHEGVKIKGDRVCYAPELVEKARAQVVHEDTNYFMQKPGQARFELQPPFSPFRVIDPDTGEVRNAADPDLIAAARLFDSFGSQGVVPVHLPDADQRTVQVHMARLCCENSRGIGKWMSAYNCEEALCIRDMYAAAGRTEPYVALQSIHSPLRLDAYFLEILRRGRTSEGGNRGITAGGGALPQPGVSAPIYWRTAAAQGLAEALGIWITVKLIDPSVHPYASFATFPTDMRTAKSAETLPEQYAFHIFTREILRRLLGLTEAAHVGPVDGMFLSAVQGARVFDFAGSHGEELFSLPQVVIDAEKLNYVEFAMEGVEFPEEPGLASRIVEETLPETSFLTHETTLEFRKFYWKPRCFEGMSAPEAAQALYAGGDSLLPRAKEIARKRIAAHTFELPADARREIDRLYRSACKALTEKNAVPVGA